MPVLEAILSATRATLPELRLRARALERAAQARATPASFEAALRGRQVALIAEVKRRSPSAGAINEALDPVELAEAYWGGGAAAISVLTDGPFFGGSLADLEAVAERVQLPVLRKDFILDELQLLEARASGAAAVLLIVRALEPTVLARLGGFARDLGLGVLVETHTAAEINVALESGATVIGVNARDLDTFTIDRTAAWELLRQLPPEVIAVAESGMATANDVVIAAAAGADAVLVGSALAAAGHPGDAARRMAEVPRRGR